MEINFYRLYLLTLINRTPTTFTHQSVRSRIEVFGAWGFLSSYRVKSTKFRMEIAIIKLYLLTLIDSMSATFTFRIKGFRVLGLGELGSDWLVTSTIYENSIPYTDVFW